MTAIRLQGPSFRVNPYHHYKSYHLQKHVKQALRTSVAKPCFLLGWFFFEANKSNNNIQQPQQQPQTPQTPPKPTTTHHVAFVSRFVAHVARTSSWILVKLKGTKKNNEFGAHKKQQILEGNWKSTFVSGKSTWILQFGCQIWVPIYLFLRVYGRHPDWRVVGWWNIIRFGQNHRLMGHSLRHRPWGRRNDTQPNH